MGFFDLPERELDDNELDEDDDDFGDLRPAAWVPGVVPVELVVARSEQAAVVVGRIAAYPDGFELIVHTYLHRSVKRRRTARIHHPLMWHEMGEPGEPIPDELLRFGLAWPDENRATNLDDWVEAGRTRQNQLTGSNLKAAAAPTMSTNRSTGPGLCPAQGRSRLSSSGPPSGSERRRQPSMATSSPTQPPGHGLYGPRMPARPVTWDEGRSCAPLTSVVGNLLRASPTFEAGGGHFDEVYPDAVGSAPDRASFPPEPAQGSPPSRVETAAAVVPGRRGHLADRCSAALRVGVGTACRRGPPPQPRSEGRLCPYPLSPALLSVAVPLDSRLRGTAASRAASSPHSDAKSR